MVILFLWQIKLNIYDKNGGNENFHHFYLIFEKCFYIINVQTFKNMKEYNEIKQNFIKNFFDKNFRYSVVSVKKALIDKMEYAFPFKFVVYDDDVSRINLDLGDNVVLTFNLKWEIKTLENGRKLYRLINVS